MISLIMPQNLEHPVYMFVYKKLIDNCIHFLVEAYVDVKHGQDTLMEVLISCSHTEDLLNQRTSYVKSYNKTSVTSVTEP